MGVDTAQTLSVSRDLKVHHFQQSSGSDGTTIDGITAAYKHLQ